MITVIVLSALYWNITADLHNDKNYYRIIVEEW